MAKPLVGFDGYDDFGVYSADCMEEAGDDPVRLNISLAFTFGPGEMKSHPSVMAEVKRTVNGRVSWKQLSTIVIGESYEDLLTVWGKAFDRARQSDKAPE